ncbi:MAG: enoyl-ACP reductase [Phycisphaerae bacterium]|nr:enoyl-ACP reductase [Phycisphaerae bacterium]MCZ2399494.1 enoyl-ACP reductase [Phycisphaerae bacterium]
MGQGNGLMQGKRGFIFGVANDHSLAWHIAEQLHQNGAALGFNHLPNPKMERRVRELAEPIGAKLIVPCDVSDDEQIRAALHQARETMGPLDFVVHAVAFASRDALSKPFYATSRADFLQAMDISAYSLVAVCQHALPHLAEGAAILTLTYMGSVKMIPSYNVMGVCKAALESSVRYLAAELGREKKIRVNALSAGPVRTLSSAGVSGFGKMLEHYPTKAPLARNIEAAEVGKSGLYLLSDLSSGVTGEVHYVDAGYNVVGW